MLFYPVIIEAVDSDKFYSLTGIFGIFQFPQMTILVTSHAMAKVESLPYEGVKHDTPVTATHKVN